MSPRLPRLALFLGFTWVLSGLPACHESRGGDGGGQDPEQIFSTICARCHGVEGKGGLAAAGANAPRNFCDAAFQKSRSDAALKAVIRQGKGGMPGFGNLFSDAELSGLVRKIRSFSPANQAL